MINKKIKMVAAAALMLAAGDGNTHAQIAGPLTSVESTGAGKAASSIIIWMNPVQ
jgi:hypothetical protein